MDRRQLLALSGGLLTASLAGCVDDGTSPSKSSGGDDEQPFIEHCPGPEDNRVICYNALGPGEGSPDPSAVPGLLEPASETVGEGETVTLTLTNQSDGGMGTNFYDWSLQKRVDGEWFRIAPGGYPEPAMGLSPGQSHEWSLTFDNSGIEDGRPVPSSSGSSTITVGGVGGGQYAFQTSGTLEIDGENETIVFAAGFEFDRAPIELTPTDTITETTWDGDTLVAKSTRGSDSEHSRTFALDRLDAPSEDGRNVITEQLLRNSGLRDAVALAETHDADRVRVEDKRNGDPIDALLLYRDSYYDVSTR
jgi:hypothetical protein